MKQRKPNTESTVGERLRMLIGGALAFTGVFVVLVIGSFSDYHDSNVWLLGIGLTVGGLLLANSMDLIEAISGLGR
jgi:predicted branched-subunit amino acid permease